MINDETFLATIFAENEIYVLAFQSSQLLKSRKTLVEIKSSF